MPVAIVCPSCSARLRMPDSAAAMPKNVTCPKCKRAIPLSTAQMARAAAEEAPPLLSEGDATQHSRGKTSRRKWLLIAGAATGLIVTVVLLILLLGHGSVNLNNLMQVKSGMTEDEVVALLGPGEVIESNTIPAGAPSLFGPSDRKREMKTMRWKGQQNGMEAEARLTFIDGKVLMGPGDLGGGKVQDLASGLAGGDPQKALEAALGSLGGNKKGPENLSQALEQLKSKDAGERRAAMRWLASAPLDAARQAEVAMALEAAAADKSSRLGILQALRVWGSPVNVPLIAAILEESQDSLGADQLRHLAMELLGKFPDANGAAVVARFLEKPFDDEHAEKALQAMGPTADSAVVRFLNCPNGSARERARRLLGHSGAKNSVLSAQALDDLQANEPERRRLAVNWLAAVAEPDEGLRAQVAAALGKLLSASSGDLATPSLKALKVWATPESVPALLAVLNSNNKDLRHGAIEMLGQFKDERAVPALAARLVNSADRKPAGAALEQFGAKAEPELVKLIDHSDKDVRDEVRRILKLLGSKENVELRQALADLKAPDPGRKQAGLKWLERTPPDPERRSELAQAAAALLTDPDRGTQELAAKALGVWGTPEVVPDLLRAMSSTQGGVRHAIMATLGRLKDDRAVVPLAQRLPDGGDRAAAGRALQLIGARAEKEVARYLSNQEIAVRLEACRILHEIGTRASLQALREAVSANRQKHKDVASAAEAAIRAIQAR